MEEKQPIISYGLEDEVTVGLSRLQNWTLKSLVEGQSGELANTRNVLCNRDTIVEEVRGQHTAGAVGNI